jgi:DNA invertase Pin-like site-specific DNA recombinase
VLYDDIRTSQGRQADSLEVDYVIVHKIDRLARNRVDDVEFDLALRKHGVTLVSCTENIDETPSGVPLHGTTRSIAGAADDGLVHRPGGQKDHETPSRGLVV